MENRIEYLVKNLNLVSHPEGGFYKESYRSEEFIPKSGLSERFNGNRAIATLIYFMLTSGNFSAYHRIKSDEIWHFYEGSATIIHTISPLGEYKKVILGNSLDEGEVYHFVVKQGTWFAAEVKDGGSYSLVGCTVAPGFDFQDFELATLKDIPQECANHETVKRLIR